jgi:hypothetical protein
MDILVKAFNAFVKRKTEFIKKRYAFYKSQNNTIVVKDYANQFPFLKSKDQLPGLDEILKWKYTKDIFNFDEHISPILNYFISKITGLYKHGQTEKTGLCNLRILSNIKAGKLTFAISKNTLSAKEQWESRLINSLKKEYPGTPLKNLILIISSKVNELGGNATHCKSVEEAYFKFASGEFKIIFVCSNNARINDIIKFLDSYEHLSPEKRLPIDIQHDEAHNPEEGIPSKRVLVEQIIMNPYVESYVPVTASYDPIILEASTLWKKENLDMYAIDYTKNSQTVSTSPDYSSISKAKQLTFEELKAHPSFKDYKIEEFDRETFDEADQPGYYSTWTDEDEIQEDKDRRRKLEFCKFMACEKDAYNLGMNLLDNYYLHTYKDGDTIITTPIILPGIKNIHIITTPLRVVFTMSLIKYALTKDYKPISIGFYRGGIHYSYKNIHSQIINKKHGDLSDECTSEEVNNKINEILNTIKKSGESLDRPIIIMGNYKPTGESITFVNYKYGTIRSDTLLPISGQTREKDYQGFLRCCYMDTKFKEHDEKFVHPPKWIIGYKKNIVNAVSYENENDERITQLKTNSRVELIKKPVTAPGYSPVVDEKISTPCKISIQDMSDPLVLELLTILNKSSRNDEDRKRIMVLFKDMKKTQVATFADRTGKLNFDKFSLKTIRTWKKHSEKDISDRKQRMGDKYLPFEADNRFREYDSRHNMKIPYINNKTNVNTNECDLLVAIDKYEYEGFTNHKSVMWLSYRYE